MVPKNPGIAQIKKMYDMASLHEPRFQHKMMPIGIQAVIAVNLIETEMPPRKNASIDFIRNFFGILFCFLDGS